MTHLSPPYPGNGKYRFTQNSCTDIHSSIIHFSPRVKTTQKSIIWRMNFLKKCVLGSRWLKPSAQPYDNCLPELSRGRGPMRNSVLPGKLTGKILEEAKEEGGHASPQYPLFKLLFVFIANMLNVLTIWVGAVKVNCSSAPPHSPPQTPLHPGGLPPDSSATLSLVGYLFLLAVYVPIILIG